MIRCSNCTKPIASTGACEWCGHREFVRTPVIVDAATERQRVIREANAAGAVQSATLASLRADAGPMRARAERAVSIGGDQAVLKQLARDVLVLMDAVGI